MSFYERYCELCAEKNQTPTGVAVSIGISRGTVTKWKKGGTPKNPILQKIADYFNVSMDYLSGNSDIKAPANQQEPDEIAKVALFGGDTEVTPEMWDEVKNFVDFVKNKYKE